MTIKDLKIVQRYLADYIDLHHKDAPAGDVLKSVESGIATGEGNRDRVADALATGKLVTLKYTSPQNFS